jgi:hypothetical protein
VEEMKKEKDSKVTVVENFPDLKEYIEALIKMNELERAQVRGYMDGVPRNRKTA